MEPYASVFPVQIEKNKSVDLLKEAIKAKVSRTIQCNAALLKLFIAQRDGAWLRSADLESVTLDKENMPLNYEVWLADPMYFGEQFAPKEDELHVLVSVPT